MDYTAKLNFHRIGLNDDSLYNEYLSFVRENIAKVATRHYERMQARMIAQTFIQEKQLPATLIYRLRDIALCYYRLNY